MLRDMFSGLSKQLFLDKPAWYHVEKPPFGKRKARLLVVTLQTNLLLGTKLLNMKKQDKVFLIVTNTNYICSNIWRIHHNERERFFPPNHHLDLIISEVSSLVCLVWILISSMFDPQHHPKDFQCPYWAPWWMGHGGGIKSHEFNGCTTHEPTGDEVNLYHHGVSFQLNLCLWGGWWLYQYVFPQKKLAKKHVEVKCFKGWSSSTTKHNKSTSHHHQSFTMKVYIFPKTIDNKHTNSLKRVLGNNFSQMTSSHLLVECERPPKAWAMWEGHWIPWEKVKIGFLFSERLVDGLQKLPVDQLTDLNWIYHYASN